MTKQQEAISCIFPHADVEFDVTNGKKWTKDERLSYKKGALRGYLSEILPNRKYAYHYALHYKMTKGNKKRIEAAWEDHSEMIFLF